MSGDGGPVKYMTEPVSTEQALAESLRAFLDDELKKYGLDRIPQKKPKALTLRQGVCLFAFAIDVTFVYLYFLGDEQNQFLAFLYKLLPAIGLGGTLVVPYLDGVRNWLLERSRNLWLGIPFVAIAIALLMSQAPLFAAFARVDSVSPDDIDAIEVKLDGTKLDAESVKQSVKHADNGEVYVQIWGRKLRSYQLTVRDGRKDNTPEGSYHASWRDMLTTPFAQLGILTAPTVWMLYPVKVRYHDPKGELYVTAKPRSPGFHFDWPVQGYANSRLKPVTDSACLPSFSCWHTQVEAGGDSFALPNGAYVFKQVNGPVCLQSKIDFQTGLDPDVYFIRSQAESCQ